MKKIFSISTFTILITSVLSTNSIASPLIMGLLEEAIYDISEASIEAKRVGELMRENKNNNEEKKQPTMEDSIYNIVRKENSPTLTEVKNNIKTATDSNRQYIENEFTTLKKTYTKENSETLKEIDKIDNKFYRNKEQNTLRFSQIDKKISKTAKQANAGIASVAAMTNIPYATNTRLSAGLGIGNYRNGNAVAAGVQFQIKENALFRGTTLTALSWVQVLQSAGNSSS